MIAVGCHPAAAVDDTSSHYWTLSLDMEPRRTALVAVDDALLPGLFLT